MISVVGRSGSFANLIKVTTQAGATSAASIVTAQPVKVETSCRQPPISLTPYSLSKNLPSGNLKVWAGPTTKFSVRFAHTDLKVPNFDAYRTSYNKDPNQKSSEKLVTHRTISYALTGAACVLTAIGAKATVRLFLGTMAPAADVLALSKIEVKLGDIPEGKSVTIKWRGKPLFIRHRTAEEISREQAVDVSILRDPESDTIRAKDPEWLIVIGVCTHLGCVPIANAGDYGGYYCPCHGSHYDGSGRIRKGPAPLNLEVPEYVFPEPGLVVIG